MRPVWRGLALCLLACRPSPHAGGEGLDATAAADIDAAIERVEALQPLFKPDPATGFDAGSQLEIAIPAVACSSDGQTGHKVPHIPATLKAPITPALLALDAPFGQLRVYSDGELAVLGPPGWRCYGTSGSGGHELFVGPRDDRFPDGQTSEVFTGEAVHVSVYEWQGTGRGVIAELSGALFPGPAAKRLGEDPMTTYRTAPWPGEVVHVGGLLAHYEDPPHVAGVGSDGTNDEPTFGSARQIPNLRFGTLALVAIRLSGERATLIAAVQADFDERSRRCLEAKNDSCWGPTPEMACADEDPSCGTFDVYSRDGNPR